MKRKALQLLARLSFGPTVANALMVLQLIMDAVETKESRSLASYVYSQLPAAWKSPDGPASESEFIALIKAGEKFVNALRAVIV